MTFIVTREEMEEVQRSMRGLLDCVFAERRRAIQKHLETQFAAAFESDRVRRKERDRLLRQARDERRAIVDRVEALLDRGELTPLHIEVAFQQLAEVKDPPPLDDLWLPTHRAAEAQKE